MPSDSTNSANGSDWELVDCDRDFLARVMND
jgi:hypothetical protein